MAKKRPILVRCPHYQKPVPGMYDCDESGGFICAPNGSFMLSLAHCGHNAGRCTQTLCVLHRHNTGGQRSWFPQGIIVPPEPTGRKAKTPTRKKQKRRRPPATGLDGKTVDTLC